MHHIVVFYARITSFFLNTNVSAMKTSSAGNRRFKNLPTFKAATISVAARRTTMIATILSRYKHSINSSRADTVISGPLSGTDTSIWSIRTTSSSRTSSLWSTNVTAIKQFSTGNRRIQNLPAFKATTVSAAVARRRKTIALIRNELAAVVERNTSSHGIVVDSSEKNIVVDSPTDIVVSRPDATVGTRLSIIDAGADIVDAADRIVLSGTGHLHLDANQLTPGNTDACLLPPTQISGPLSGVTAYVEVYSGSENRSEYIADEVRALGATVCPRLLLNRVTHVIFREGRSRTLLRAWAKKIPVVSVLWVDSCAKNNEKVAENSFEITPDAALNGETNLLRSKSFKCMQPEHFDAEVVLSDDRVKKRAKRVEAFRLMKEITNYKIAASPRQTSCGVGDSRLVQDTPPYPPGGENAPKTPYNVSTALAQKWCQLRDDCTPDTLRLEMVELRKRIAEFIESPTSSAADTQQDTLSQTIRKKLFASPKPLCNIVPTVTVDAALNNDVKMEDNTAIADTNSSVSIGSLVFIPKRDEIETATVAINTVTTAIPSSSNFLVKLENGGEDDVKDLPIFTTLENKGQAVKAKRLRSSIFAVKTRLSAANRLQDADRPSSEEFASPVFIGRGRRCRSKTTNQFCSDQSASTTNQILPVPSKAPPPDQHVTSRKKAKKTTKNRATTKKCPAAASKTADKGHRKKPSVRSGHVTSFDDRFVDK